MDIDRFIQRMIKDRGFRSLVLLVLSMVVFVGVFSYQVVQYLKDRPVEGSIRRVMCGDCKFEETRLIADIHDQGCKCNKCGGKLGEIYICGKCQFEFPYTDPVLPRVGNKLRNMDDPDYFAARKCPNCGSQKLAPKVFVDPGANAQPK
jgi:hypothetical protein